MTLKNMIKLGFVFALVWTVGLNSAQAVSATVGDDFNDGIPNATLWSVPSWSSAKVKENSGRLRFFSNPNYTNDPLWQLGEWDTSFIRKYNGADSLNIYGKVRVPHMIASDPGGPVVNDYEIGLGLVANTNWNYVELTVRDSQSNRQFGVFYFKDSSHREYTSYPAPTNISIFNLRLRYMSATDRLDFFWAEAGSSTWTKIGPGYTMGDLFGGPKTKRMFPYVTAYTENVMVMPGWNVWLDNFSAVYIDKPLP